MIPALCALLTTALAASDGEGEALDTEALADTLEHQVERHLTELWLPEAPPLYHLRYHLVHLDQVDVTASLGSVVRAAAAPWSVLGVEVRVGEPDFDNTGFGGWQNGFARATLPRVPTPDTLALEAWRLTDGAYKEAVEQHARKSAQFTPPADHPGDYTMTGAVVADRGSATADPTPGPMAELATSLSHELVGPAVLERGEVLVGHEAGSVLTVDSEGTRVHRPFAETTVRAVAHLRTDDGMLLTDHRLWTVRAADDLPAAAAMATEVGRLYDDLVALSEVEALSEEYVGPVIFEDAAAVDLFRYVLLQQLEGTPAEVPFESFFGDLGSRHGPVRLGRRVLPPGWDVIDDPQRLPEHPGAFSYDWEGTPAERVVAVTDGIVREVFMSRIPRKGTDGTNGHGRGFVGRRAEGRASLLEVVPPRTRSRASVRRRALKLARSYGRDWVLVVRRLQEPGVRGMAGYSYNFDPDDGETALPPPVAIVRVYADGREEVLRGARFASVQRWVLRDIVAAGPMVEGSWLAPLSSGYSGIGPTEGLPSWTRAPEVLVGEVEIVPAPGDPREVPTVPPPVATP